MQPLYKQQDMPELIISYLFDQYIESLYAIKIKLPGKARGKFSTISIDKRFGELKIICNLHQKKCNRSNAVIDLVHKVFANGSQLLAPWQATCRYHFVWHCCDDSMSGCAFKESLTCFLCLSVCRSSSLIENGLPFVFIMHALFDVVTGGTACLLIRLSLSIPTPSVNMLAAV